MSARVLLRPPGHRTLALLVSIIGACAPLPAPMTEDQTMDAYASRIEELQASTGLSCTQRCALRPGACRLSSAACELAGRAPARGDFARTCTRALEQCARFGDSCERCSR
jgi:hypothetical protein